MRRILFGIIFILLLQQRKIMASSLFRWGELLSKEAAILLPCSNRPDGKYAIATTFRYLECRNGISKYRDCGKGEIFVASCGRCLVQIESQQNSFCYGRVSTSPIGKIIRYQNPWSCSSWFECLYGIPSEYHCQRGLYFSPEKQRCIIGTTECKLAYKTAPNFRHILTGRPSRVDAAFLWPDGNLMLTAGSTFFKFDKHKGSLLHGFPLTMLGQDESGIPPNIDAALTLPGDKTFFFKQDLFWQWENESPRRIADNWNGVPGNLDSAFYWEYNHKAYFFKGEYFYRYDTVKEAVDFGYPSLIVNGWPGASPTIDAATSLKNGTVYLIKRKKVFAFHPPVCKEDITFIDEHKSDVFVS